MTDEDMFGPAPPHPIERSKARVMPVLRLEDVDPRQAPKNLEVVKRMKSSRFWSDVCTCSVGDPDRVITEERKPKCCKVCLWCSMRIKIGFLKEHQVYCMAVDRSSVPLPWWRRPPGVSSAQPTAGVTDAKPIKEASAVHESSGARVQTGSSGSTAGQRRKGIRGGGQKPRNKKSPGKSK